MEEKQSSNKTSIIHYTGYPKRSHNIYLLGQYGIYKTHSYVPKTCGHLAEYGNFSGTAL